MKRRWRTRTTVGLAEGAVLLAVGSLWLAGADGGFSITSLIDVWTDPDALILLGVWTGLILAGQGAMLLPVRRPTPMREGGNSVLVSLAVAGAGASLLLSAWVWSAFELFHRWDAFTQTPGAGWAMLGMILVGWLIATPLLLAFCRKGPRDLILARLSSGLFLGTALETIAIMPIDIMVRKRTDCYCGSGTFLALTATGSVGLLALGPAIIAPLVMRRRRRWWRSRCEHCGYDMRGSLDADRCPECGAGWRE